jgi:membrane associated rhomboid family serine protease
MHGQADTPLPPNSADGRWYAHVGGKNYGPYIRRDIERMVQSGQILGTDFLCIVGGSAWVQADAAPEFRALFQTRPPLAQSARAPGPSKIYKARRALQLWRGLILIAIGLLGFLPLRHIGDWLAGGPKPEPERFFVLAFLLLLPIGALRLFNALRGRPLLTVTRQGIKLDMGLLDMGLRAKSAYWDGLEPFTVRIVRTGQLGKRFRIATATIIGPNAGRGLLRAKTFRIPDIFVEPIGSIVAQLNAARAEALGVPDTAAVAAAEPEEAAVGLADFKLPWLTLALLGVLIAVFALEIRFAVQSSSGLSLGPATLFVFGGLTRRAVLSGGEWYRLFTAPLLHANLAHIVGNGLALLWGGWLLERLVGRLWFFSFFAVGALGGSLLSLAVMPAKMI